MKPNKYSLIGPILSLIGNFFKILICFSLLSSYQTYSILYGMKTNDMLIQIGENIRSIRKGRKLSQERLAELSDMHPSHISDIERGKVNASITAYFMIAQALKVPLSDLANFTTGKGDRKVGAVWGQTRNPEILINDCIVVCCVISRSTEYRGAFRPSCAHVTP